MCNFRLIPLDRIAVHNNYIEHILNPLCLKCDHSVLTIKKLHNHTAQLIQLMPKSEENIAQLC